MKTLILTGIFLVMLALPVNAQVFELSSCGDNSLNKTVPMVYKPSRLLIGEKNKFVLKAEPGSFVSLALSENNQGAPLIAGHHLRIGQTVNVLEAQVADNGVLELELDLPDEKDIVGKILYFETLVWKKDDLSDIVVAKIIGIDGREAPNNALLIAAPIRGANLPVIGPAMPGMGNYNQTMDAINAIHDNEESTDAEYMEHMQIINQPVIMRNLRVPEVQE